MGLSNALIERVNRQTAESLPYRGRVIDLGCGDALYKAHILTKADEYVGVDWERTEHDRGAVDVYADLSRPPLPFDAETADTVVAFQVMEHLPEPLEFLTECYRLLRPGGALFITVPFMWEVHEAPRDFYRFTRYGLDYLLKRAGLSIVGLPTDEILERAGLKVGGPSPSGLAVEGTDFHAVIDRGIAITPIHLDLTGRRHLRRLKAWSWPLELPKPTGKRGRKPPAAEPCPAARACCGGSDRGSAGERAG